MLREVKLVRFRGFKELHAALRPVSVVVGRNSSGKTSVLHAIRMAVEALSIGLSESRPHLDKDGWITVCWGHIVWDHARLCPVPDWEELFTNKEVGEGSSMRIELAFDDADTIQDLHAEFAYARNSQLKMTVRLRSSAASEETAALPAKSKFRGDRLVDILNPSIPRTIFVPPFYGVTWEEEYRSWSVVREQLGGGNQGRIVRNLMARLGSDELRRLNDFLGRSGVGTVSTRTSTQDAEDVRYLRVGFTDTNGELELSSAGAGLVNLIALYASMVRFARPSGAKYPVIYLLDEPEAHLHPRLQGDIGLALASMASEFGAQLVIATHSVEMINRLSARKDATLLAVDRASSAAIQLDSEAALLGELGQWCDLTPFASINFLAKKRIVFHEGPTDKKILDRCAELYFRNQPDKLDRFRRWTFVPLNGSGNANSQAVLGAVLNPGLFPGLSPKEPVRVICILDRDAERKEGFHPVKTPAKGAFEALTLVWPRHSIESLFLDPARLATWIALVLPPGAVDPSTLLDLVEQGIQKANASPQLNMDATMQRIRAHLRAKEDEAGDKWQLVAGDALKHASNEVMASPETWQRGKDRAQTILEHVRDHITSDTLKPGALKNRIYGTITQFVEVAAVDKLGDTMTLIPSEIRDLLDRMVTVPSTPPPAAA